MSLADVMPRARYSSVPSWVRAHPDVTPRELAVYLALDDLGMGREAFQCRVETIAAKSNYCVRSVQYAEATLIRIGALEVEPTDYFHPGLGQRRQGLNRYRLVGRTGRSTPQGGMPRARPKPVDKAVDNPVDKARYWQKSRSPRGATGCTPRSVLQPDQELAEPAASPAPVVPPSAPFREALDALRDANRAARVAVARSPRGVLRV